MDTPVSRHSLVLNHDSQTGRRTTLQRWQPGACDQQHVFVHGYVEEIFMVEGDYCTT